MLRLYSLAISVLTLAALPAFLALGDTSKPVTTAAKKKPANVTAAKRAKAAPPTTAASRARAKTSSAAQSTAGRATIRKVVVTRKKVNGKWVRSSRIVKVPAPPSYQLHPDTERYQQIQQALAAKGFFKGEANGQWGDDSVDALKRFQASTNLPDDGKISSLSLINLGLGPKHEGSITPAPPMPTPNPGPQ
jgi:hypothetical protein